MKSKIFRRIAAGSLAMVFLLTACGKEEEEVADDPYDDMDLEEEEDLEFVNSETGEPVDLASFDDYDVRGMANQAYSEWEGLSYQKILETDEGKETTDFLLDNKGNLHITKKGLTEAESYLIKTGDKECTVYTKTKKDGWVKSPGVKYMVTPAYLADKHAELSSILDGAGQAEMEYKTNKWLFSKKMDKGDLSLAHLDQNFFILDGDPVLLDGDEYEDLKGPFSMLFAADGMFIEDMSLDFSKFAKAKKDSPSDKYKLTIKDIRVKDLSIVHLPEEAEKASEMDWEKVETDMPKNLNEAD